MSPQEISREELQLAARNHGMPLEALRYDLTPAGLHYLLIHFDIPDADAGAWRLSVEGRVRRPLALSIDDLAGRPAVSLPVTLECAGNGRTLFDPRPVSQPWIAEAASTAEWTGTPLRPILEEAGPLEDADEVVFTAMDRGIDGGVEQDYERSLSLDDALRDEVLLAWAMNGQQLLPQHGFPLRLIVPGWYGMTHVKWLRRITVSAEPFAGYQQAHAYRWRTTDDEPGRPLTRIMPRSLMIPPGIPEFLSRVRRLDPGPCVLRGRAWSGHGPVERVDVSVDDGRTWAAAELGEPLSPFAWRPWSFRWDASPGRHVLCSRAADAAGNEQPLHAEWNVGGYTNNSVQRVEVVVGDASSGA